MSNPNIPFRDRTAAAVISGLSATFRRVGILEREFVAAAAPNYVPVSWQVANESADEVPGWAEFQPDPSAGLTPHSYRRAGILSADKKALDAAKAETGGQHAAAWAVGKAVMYGVLPENYPFGEIEDKDADRHERRYAVAMRIGQGPLKAAMGLWVPDDNRLVFPDPSVRAGARVPLDLVPPRIPIV